MTVRTIALTDRDSRQLTELLEEVRTQLYSSIDTCLLAGEKWPIEQQLRKSVARDRRLIRTSIRLETLLRRGN